MKNLVIVESPAKAKTIEKFLGPDYTVMSSRGHIRDLQKKEMSVNTDTDFTPIYEIPDDKKELVRQLKSAAKQADTVWLASDEDREGEAIAWHLAEVLNLDPKNTKRIVFHEITKPAILNAIEHPRHIDLNLVNAQQARRVLDRIVGFELSPILWRKIKPALSAGRVQSVAVRLICERENEIRAFTPTSFYRINAIFTTSDGLSVKAEGANRFEQEEEALNFLELCKNTDFEVAGINVKPLTRKPAPPFTTSTLQQDAGRRLGFSVNTTMRIAQKLYEDGRITYMRTDSTNLSQLAISEISKAINEDYGKEYLKVRHYHTNSKGAQEAHEAIRPTYISNRTIPGSRDEQRLYDLIWKRAVASQMSDALLEKTSIEIVGRKSPETIFHSEGETIKFEGFMRAYGVEVSDDAPLDSHPGNTLLPPINIGDLLSYSTITATQRFTMPPSRYTEASLVKKMEDLGIGRPSTYAPTISTIQHREYITHGDNEGAPRPFDIFTLSDNTISKSVQTENVGGNRGKLVPTDIGMVVNEFLTEYFPNILDYNFTARVEEKFDDIAEGRLPWQKEMEDFYADFHPAIEEVSQMRLENKVGERILGNDPENGKRVSVKIGRYGPVVQIGEANEAEKPRFASLTEGQSINTITLEQALKLFDLPRSLGEYEGAEVKTSIGRFGPYVVHNNVFTSIPKDLSPYTITLNEAISLINQKRQSEINKHIKSFDEMPEVEILNGRFGPYIALKKEGLKKALNYKIPKGTDPASLTVEDVRKLIADQDKTPKTPRRTTRKK